MGKLIFILLDGLTFPTATETAGYVERMVAIGQGAKYRIQGELPSLSRPMFETLFTGVPAEVHGITGNGIVRRSNQVSVFDLCRDAGLVSAAAAYSWMSELYVKCPFDLLCDRVKTGGEGAISYGFFYNEDNYPDNHLLADAEALRTLYHPDFLLFHPMGIDNAGHLHGGGTREYVFAANNLFSMIGERLPEWIADGYQVLITADHGMNVQGTHGGNTTLLREVPLYLISPLAESGDFSDHTVSQLDIAPLTCRLLGIAPSSAMKEEIEIRLHSAA